jgi:DNA polymerase-3 subunit alpha
MSKFINLHLHTTFSIYDGLSYPKDHAEYILQTANQDKTGMAITDHGVAGAFGYAFSLQKQFEKNNTPFKMIYGIEAYYIPSIEQWKIEKEKDVEQKKENKKLSKEEKQDISEEEDIPIEDEEESFKEVSPIKRRHHLVILAANQEGLKNLYKLISLSNIEGYYRYPRMDFKLLEQYNKGLIISTACIGGYPNYLLKKQAKEDNEIIIDKIFNRFDKELKPLLDLFDKRCYLELQFNKLKEQKTLNDCLIGYSEIRNIPLIVTSDAHYPRPELWKHREIYKALGYQRKSKELSTKIMDLKEEFLKCALFPHNAQQIYKAYENYYKESDIYDNLIKEAINRTYTIAYEQIERVDLYSKPKLPKFVPTKEFEQPMDKLKKLTIDGLKTKGLDKNKNYVNRAVKELKLIKEKEFEQYFLTLKEAIDELKKYVLIAPGRGSDAGSLVCYLLGITQIDPIKEGLLFERFISEARKDFPDCDTDISDRDVAYETLKSYFGENKIALVTNYSTLQLKSLVKDISKLYEVPFQEVNEITKVMEEEAKNSILEEINHDQKLYEFTYEKAKKYSHSFKEYLKQYPDVEICIEKLYKQIRAYSTHAGGTIICNNIIEDMPLMMVKKKPQTPWSEGLQARHLEQMGLIKYDFLGLATLRFIQKCIELILENNLKRIPTGEEVRDFYNNELHPSVINTKDKQVYENVYHNGRFINCFQFSETPVQNFCKQVRPESIDDISCITSLYRPGPLSGKADKKLLENKGSYINYEHPILKEVLEISHGILVYQEQFILLAHKLGGFSLEESDELRKLLVKPSHELGEELIEKRNNARERFINGCVKNNLPHERAIKLWDEEILGFISYGFNKSHSCSYSYISFQCAYLLTYYEKEWIQACLQFDEDRDKILNDVTSLGYRLNKPDINLSSKDWSISNKEIYPALNSLKGIGDVATEELFCIKQQHGQFKDLQDLLFEQAEDKPKWRWSKFNKKAFCSLIQAEGFNSLNCVGEEKKIFKNYKHMFNVFTEHFDEIKKAKTTIEEIANNYPDKSDWTNGEKIQIQKEILGIYDKNLLFNKKVLDIFLEFDILPLSDLDEGSIKPHLYWFIINEVKEKMTKNNKKYYQLKISDIDNKNKYVNFFGEVKDKIEKNSIYITELFMNNGWINVPFGKPLLKAADMTEK